MTPAWFAIIIGLQQSVAADTAATKAALLAADRELAQVAGSARPEALLDRLEPGAVVLFPDAPILRGSEAAAPYRERYASSAVRVSWTPLHAVASSDGDFGCTTGYTSFITPNDPGRGAPAGRYVTCWRQDPSAGWRIVAHARNGEGGGAGAAAAAAGAAAGAPDTMLAGAPHSAVTSGDDLSAAFASDALFSRMALDVGPGPAFSRFAADDGMLLVPRGAPIRGKTDIGKVFGDFPATQRLMWGPSRDVGRASGGLAVTVGEAVTAPPGGGPVQARSKYLTVWRLETTGDWRFVFDLGSSRPAGPFDQHYPLLVRLQARLDSLHTQGHFPGATFAAALADGSVLALATGLSDTVLKQPMTPDGLMPQGSVGKTYVSALALQLVQEGKLELDVPVSRYLGTEPWFDRLPNAQDITVRQLMNHTSGLVRYEFSPRFTADLTKAPADKVWDPRDLIRYIFDTKAPFKAGTSWQYSDTNYMVLGLILERLTGAPMIAEIQRRIIEPNNLQQTEPNLSARVPGVVQGYAGPNNPFGGTDAMLSNGRFAFNPQFEWAGGGWSSTTADLARWAKLLYEWKIFDPSLEPRFLNGVSAQLGPNVKYGLGVMIWTTPLGTALGHSGFFPGYQTEMRYLPREKLAVALQVNSSNGRTFPKSPGETIVELAEMVAGVENRK